MTHSNKIYGFVFSFLLFFWVMTLLPLESQQSDGQLSLEWTMIYALAAAVGLGYFTDVVIGQWYPELNGGAQVPRPRNAVRRPIAFFLHIFVGLYFVCALGHLSRGAADKSFAAGRMSVASLVATLVVMAIFYGLKYLLCRKKSEHDGTACR